MPPGGDARERTEYILWRCLFADYAITSVDAAAMHLGREDCSSRCAQISLWEYCNRQPFLFQPKHTSIWGAVIWLGWFVKLNIFSLRLNRYVGKKKEIRTLVMLCGKHNSGIMKLASGMLLIYFCVPAGSVLLELCLAYGHLPLALLGCSVFFLLVAGGRE